MPNPSLDVQKVLDALPAMVSYWDRDVCNGMANAAYVDFFGLSPREMRGTHLSKVLGDELYAKSRPYVEGALRGEPQVFDREIRTPAGELRYTQASYVPDLDENGEVQGFFALVTDITERRRIEEEVERSRARLAEAERIARLGSWEWDIAGKDISLSAGFMEIYGMRPGEISDRFTPGESKYVYPEDRERVEQELRQTVETGAPMDFEYRIVRPDGHVRRLHTRAELIADADGNPSRISGTVQDVTELRAAADVLHQTAGELGRRAAELHRLPVRRHDEDLVKVLTSRQIEILGLVAEGLSNSEIASRLYLGESTVKWHIRKILRTLGVANRAQAVARYLSSASSGL